MRCGWTRFVWSAPAVLATCGWAGGCGAPLLSIVSARTVWSNGRERAPWPAIAAILVIARLCEPASELHIAEDWYRRTALDDLLGAPAERINDDRLYRALDRLPPHKQALETHLKERLGALFDLDYELLLYDVTSTYFEGQAEGNGLARRGYSRDHRGDCKQVCIGLVVTRDGVPLGYEVFAGNRTDVTTVEEIVTTMESRYGQARRVWVMDRGMASAENIAWLRGGQRLYVIGASKSELKKFAGELADRRNWRQVRDGVEAKVCAGPDGSETFLLGRSAERQQKEEAMHARFCERIETALASLQRRIERAQKPIDRGAAERQIGRLLGRNSRAAARYAIRLVDQAVDRTSACDEVWLAVGASKRGRGRENDARVKKPCRFLGFGLLTVTADGRVDVVAEPAPWKPRRDAKRRSRIVEEHRRRKGDPIVGGSTRTPQMTAYRQQALAVANALAGTPGRPRDLRILAPDAAKILQGNVYGWFERIERGLYRLTSSGRVALVTWANHVSAQTSAGFGGGPNF